MSTNENIITGLRLSEAIKLIEENSGALIKRQDIYMDWQHLQELKIMFITDRYDIKLPPPKTVTVTRADVGKAWNQIVSENGTFGPADYSEAFLRFCKELGL